MEAGVFNFFNGSTEFAHADATPRWHEHIGIIIIMCGVTHSSIVENRNMFSDAYETCSCIIMYIYIM